MRKNHQSFLLTLIEQFQIMEKQPWCEDEIEILKLHEAISYLKQMEQQQLTEYPQMLMWELWTRLFDHLSLSSSEFDKVMRDKNQLAVITVHQSKGLEFDHVIIPFLNRNSFPLEFIGSNPAEECRLFYVAMTRAKETLLLTRHIKESTNARKEREKSPFIDFLYTSINN